MPLTTTFATLSARGFGLFGKRKVLTTVTFPAGTSTWTAPPGVISITSGVGSGSNGAGGFFYDGSFYYTYFGNLMGGSNLGNSPPYPSVSSSCTYDIVSYINGYSGLQYIGNVQFYPVIIFQISSFDGTYTTPLLGQTFPEGWTGGGWIVGGTAAASQIGAYFWGVTYQTYSFPYDGVATTAFGYSWPGGTAGPAPTTTYTNIPVTPGTTYTIVNNGSLTITYNV